MRSALVLLFATLSAGVSAAGAQNPAPSTPPPPVSNAVQILSTSQLAALADSLPAGASTSHSLVRWAGLSDMISRRDTSGIHERHEDFTDIFVVQRGTATLRYGGTTDGAKLTTSGEWRGGTIRNGSEAVLHPGDIVVIPTGIPHQVLPSAGEHFIYLTFKVAKAAQH